MNQNKINPTTAVLQREVTRKEFLATVAIGTASVMGFSNVIRLLTGKSIESHLTHKVSAGYGSSNYGG
jgi:hypothetical protein